jgi:hypothetical protein
MVSARRILDAAEMHLAGRVSLSGIVDFYGVESKWYYRMRNST